MRHGAIRRSIRYCEDPWCISACPRGAMQRRLKDGILFSEPGKTDPSGHLLSILFVIFKQKLVGAYDDLFIDV